MPIGMFALLIIASAFVGAFVGVLAAGFIVFAWSMSTLHNSKKRRNNHG